MLRNLIIDKEKSNNETTIVKSFLYFNIKNSNSLKKMITIIELADEYPEVILGQIIGEGYNEGGLIAYRFKVPTKWVQSEKEFSVLRFHLEQKFEYHEFIQKMEVLLEGYKIEIKNESDD